MRTLMLTLLLAACSGDDEPAAPAPAEPAPADPAAALPPAGVPPAEVPPPTAEASGVARTRIGARHILVSYQGALGADNNLRRSKEEARARAAELLKRVRAGEDFAAVARASSDDPGSKVMGGDLGAFDRGAMTPAFETAAFALKEGEISGVVETPFGFHVIQRYALNEIHVAHVIVQWEGIDKKAPKRSKEEARARAEEARAKLQAGEPVDQVSRAYSDGPTAARGGDLGWFQKGQMMPAFDAAAFKLQPGQISEVVESPLGYHVIVRVE